MSNHLKWAFVIVFLAFLGLLDATYLTIEHYQNRIPPCTTGIFADCGKVLKSPYATVAGVPLALTGMIFYSLVFLSSLYYFRPKADQPLAETTHKKRALYILLFLTPFGFLASLYFVFLQVIVIQALCLYCMVSALISTLIFLSTQLAFSRERKYTLSLTTIFVYKKLVKHIFFLIDPEIIHTQMTMTGQFLGSIPLIRSLGAFMLRHKESMLTQTIKGIDFELPIGLAAGFDYEARLPQILPSLGFGFGTIGTITNHSYGGNPKPMLGRLPKSKSLMVNKGFKNLGATATITKLTRQTLRIPVGISIGRTNSQHLVTQKESVQDIVQAFKKFEASHLHHAYYELNISCPNLYGDVSFYPPKNLDELLTGVDKLKLKRPIFIKMPIEKSDREVLAMLAVIVKHNIQGVIFGNLQKNRKDPALVQEEVAQFPVGNFSGKPTFERSNELIRLTYKHYKKLIIIGCGGVFNAHDAYAKITLGASLVQLITGMIYEGPTLISRINYELVELLKQDGFMNIKEAIGSRN